MSHPISTPTHLRSISFLFIAAFLSWFLPVVFLMTTPLGKVGAAFITTSWNEFIKLLQPYRTLWVIWQLLDILSFAFAALGIYRLYEVLKETRARTLASASLLAMIGSVVFWLLRRYIDFALTSDVASLPPLVSHNEQLRGPLQFGAIALLSLSTACVGFELFTSRLLKRTGLVIGLLSATLFVLDAVINVSRSFKYAVGIPSLAPFLLLMILGIGLLQRKN